MHERRASTEAVRGGGEKQDGGRGSSEAPAPSACGSLGAEAFDPLRGALGPALDTGDRPHVPVLRISLPLSYPPPLGSRCQSGL